MHFSLEEVGPTEGMSAPTSAADMEVDHGEQSTPAIKQEVPAKATLPSDMLSDMSITTAVRNDQVKGFQVVEDWPVGVKEVAKWADHTVDNLTGEKFAAAIFVANALEMYDVRSVSSEFIKGGVGVINPDPGKSHAGIFPCCIRSTTGPSSIQHLEDIKQVVGDDAVFLQFVYNHPDLSLIHI